MSLSIQGSLLDWRDRQEMYRELVKKGPFWELAFEQISKDKKEVSVVREVYNNLVAGVGEC